MKHIIEGEDDARLNSITGIFEELFALNQQKPISIHALKMQKSYQKQANAELNT